jgi:hypothetical protein
MLSATRANVLPQGWAGPRSPHCRAQIGILPFARRNWPSTSTSSSFCHRGQQRAAFLEPALQRSLAAVDEPLGQTLM